MEKSGDGFEIEGFTGAGHSVEDCLYQAKWGMIEHVRLLDQQRLPVPVRYTNPRIVIENGVLSRAS